MIRVVCFLLAAFFSTGVSAQFAIPAYTVVKDSATRTTVFHSGMADKMKLGEKNYTDALPHIAPDIRIINGIVDHKTLMGDMLVREYYVDSVLIGYVEFDGADMQREVYYYNGKPFLEKRYDKGNVIYTRSGGRASSGH